MNNRIKILGAFIPLCLLLCFMSNTYSRYVADTTGNLKIAFAQWQILVNNSDITNNTTSSVVLNPIINKNEYVENNKLAPSSSGYFDISIDPTNVDVAFNYEITLSVVNDNIPDLMISKYAILDKDYQEGNTITYNNIENNKITGSLDLDKIASGTDEIIESNFEPFIIRVFFEWYEGESEQMNDKEDTLIATSTDETELEISAEIKFEQKLGENTEQNEEEQIEE